MSEVDDNSCALAEARRTICEWIAYADRLEEALELAAGQSKDQLIKLHAEQGLRLRLVRPSRS